MALQKRSAPRIKRMIKRYADQSVANTQLTVSSVADSGKAFRLVAVLVKWSAVVTKDVTVTLNSGLGTAWDTLIQTIVFAGERNGVFIPDQELWFMDDDAIDVVAPAGGGGITSAVQLILETK